MGTKICGVASSEHLDSSAEILLVSGANIDDMVEGKATLNWEHSNASEDQIGYINYAKKIFSEDDCELPIQKKFFEKLKKPYIFISGELLDDEGNIGAIAVASMVKYCIKQQIPLLIGFSVEGSTLERDANILKRSVIRKTTITLRPCNKTAIAEALDPETEKLISELDKSELTGYEIDYNDFIIDDLDFVQSIQNDVKEFKKTLTAGMGNVAPSGLVGGAALSVEDPNLKAKIKDIVFKWDKKRPLREVIKAALPELSDEYIDYFTELIPDELSLKKTEVKPQRISSNDSSNPLVDEDQKKLIEGLYLYPEHNLSVNKTARITNDSGDDVLLQSPKDDSHKQQASYSYLAKNFFNLGDNVPTTNYFMHKSNPLKFVVVRKKIEGKSSLLSDGYERAIEQSKNDDNYQKLFLMDLITGTHRCYHNIVTDNGNKIYFIDNKAFNYGNENGHVFLQQIKDDLLNLSTKEWLKRLDSKVLAKYMQLLGFDTNDIQHAVYRLKAVRHFSDKNMPITNIFNTLNKSNVV